MQTKLAESIKHTAEGKEADAILRKCVHCGFCLATCPTYQLLGDELDSPRGRIYLIKQMLEGEPVTARTQTHLDRCLTCRNCETTCPSGVEYGRLVDIGRGFVEQRVTRSPKQRIERALLRTVLPKPWLVRPLVKLGQLARPMLPAALKRKMPARKLGGAWPDAAGAQHARTMVLLDGCVQPTFAPNINAAAARLLDRLSIALVRADKVGCCGAIDYHLGAHEAGKQLMRANIDAWWPHIERGAESIVVTASGCGALVKEYGHLLRDDPVYAHKAARVTALMRDVSEVIAAEHDRLSALLASTTAARAARKIAFHSPCTLQHGLKLRDVVEPLLRSAGCELSFVADAHLCCGSAGTYSILQPKLSQQLLANKVRALEAGEPEEIVTANIGCLMHIESGSRLRVRHWVELIDEILTMSAERAA